MVEHAAHPVLLDGADFLGAEVGEHLVENAYQDLVFPRDAHRQLIAIGGFAADVETVELELTQAPDTGGEVADHGVHFVGGQGLQRRADIGHGHQVQVRVVGAQQFVRGVVFHHRYLEAVQFLSLIHI